MTTIEQTNNFFLLQLHCHWDLEKNEETDGEVQIVNLAFLTNQEAQRFNFFVFQLCQWSILELPHLLSIPEDLLDTWSGVLEPQDTIPDLQATVTMVQQSFNSFLRQQVINNWYQPLPQLEKKPDPLFEKYAGKVPILYIKIARRLAELRSYLERGVFRENGDVQERDAILDLLNKVGAGRDLKCRESTNVSKRSSRQRH